jgi:polyhydroxyalkanoate synthase
MTQQAVLWCAIAMSAFVFAWWAHLWFWHRRLSAGNLAYALEERIRVADGGHIFVRRLAGAHSSDAPPVLLVHGLAVNHRNHDAIAECSFARFLHEQGRDVWLVTLRSGQTSLFPFGSQKAFKAMRDHDLPRAVEEVLARTGSPRLDLCCYSMGGMVVYAALSRSINPGHVRRVLAFASPGKVRPLGMLAWARFLPRVLTPAVPMRLFMRTAAFAHRILPRAGLHVFYNSKNVPPERVRTCMIDLFEDIPGALGADFLRWSADNGRVSVDGEGVLEGLRKIEVPACFFAGTCDFLAPSPLVRAAYDAWGADAPGTEKHFILLGKSFGTREEYGHGDFAFGTHAREEVFMPALAFLDGVFAHEGLSPSVHAGVLPGGVVFDHLTQPHAQRDAVDHGVLEGAR